MSFKVPEKYRIRGGNLQTSEADGNNGAFLLPARPADRGIVSYEGAAPPPNLFAIASDGLDWEHVSVTTVALGPQKIENSRCPTWEEMSYVKAMFWGPEDTVIQIHPPASEYVNNHPYCLHLWREVGKEFELPPSICVGLKGVSPA